jgi:hypothetical protein
LSQRPELDEFVQRAFNMAGRTRLDSAAVEVLDAFAAGGTEALLLKGPVLARVLYRPDEHRAYGDLDLLVPPSDLDRARRVLPRLGYINESDELGIDDVAGVVRSETWSRLKEAPIEGATVMPPMIDLHWGLAGCEADAETTWRVLSTRRTWIEIAGRRVPVLDLDGLALHAATHAAQHGPDNLKVLADLARALERWDRDVWRSAAQLAERVEGTPAFAAGLRLVPAGAELARELGLPPTDELTWAILNRESRPRGTFHLDALVRARGVRERLDVLRRSLFPSRKWIRWHYGLDEDAGWLRLAGAYAAQLLRAPAWAARAWGYRHRRRRAGS